MQVSSVKNAFILLLAILQTFAETNRLFNAFPTFDFYPISFYITGYDKK